MTKDRSILPSDDLPEKLYHYTNWKAFQNIIESGTLWAMDARSMQNQGELTYDGIILEYLKKEHTHPSGEQIRNYYEILKKKLDVFVCSFAMDAPDSAYHWKKFARGHDGIAFAIEQKEVHMLKPPIVKSLLSLFPKMKTVYYDPQNSPQNQEANSAAQKQVEKTLNLLIKEFESTPKMTAQICCVFLLASMKHIRFQKENEYRIAVSRQLVAEEICDFLDQEKITLPYAKHDKGNGRRYIELIARSGNEQTLLPISEICIPSRKFRLDYTKEQVCKLLESKSYPVNTIGIAEL